jgi:hypothetical protein
MEKFRSDKLGIEIEINETNFFEIRETKNCIRVFCKNKKVITVLPDSKIEFENPNHLVCYRGRVVVFGDLQIEVGGASRVFARDKTCVVASQGAEVRANGRAKVRALDNSRVIAGGRAKVWLDGESKGYKKTCSRVKMNKLGSRAAIVDITN